MQHITGPLAIECHDRCARFHILTLHMVRDLEQNQVGFVQMEEQQLMNSKPVWFETEIQLTFTYSTTKS